VETNQGVRHGLTWDSLHVPAIADPLQGPVLLSVRASNQGNVHEVIDPLLCLVLAQQQGGLGHHAGFS
jgi:hypothetical protein